MTMRTGVVRKRVASMGATLGLAASLLGSPGTTLAAGPVVGNDFAGLCYELAVNPSDTVSTSPEFSDFRSLDKSRSKQISGGSGTARAKARVTASVTNTLDDLITVSATGSIEGTAVTRRHPSVDWSSTSRATVDLGISWAVVSGFAPVIISTSLSASDTSNDCSSADATLDIDTDQGSVNLERTVGAGDCATSVGTASFTGLTSGGAFSVELDGETLADPGNTESYAASFTVRISFPAGSCTVLGSPAGEPLDGTDGPDVICGEGGNDTIHGKRGNDFVFGGSDTDVIDGGPGNDTIYGLDGGDILRGGSGRDRIMGGAGADIIDDSRGPNALLSGGPDADQICGSNQDDVIQGDAGVDFIIGGGGDDVIDGGAGDDILKGEFEPGDAAALSCPVLSISGVTHLDDTIRGGSGDDILRGGKGDDVMRGDSGSDKLEGDAGADSLIGGTRKDVLNGGSGPDTLNACDGVRDVVIGGSSHDTAKADVGHDSVQSDVETVHAC